jgi:GxxExxY protein
MNFDALSNQVIGCSIEVHRELGPGLLESTYEQCLMHELTQKRIKWVAQTPLPVKYKGLNIDCGYRVDLLIENNLIVELKSVESLQRIHEAQILTYMKMANIKTSLLINFNV